MKPFAGRHLKDANPAIKYLLRFDNVLPDPGVQKVEEIEEIANIVNGAGMGLLTVLDGGVCGLILLSSFLSPAVGNIETLIPDHDAVSVSVPTEASEPEQRPVEAPNRANG